MTIEFREMPFGTRQKMKNAVCDTILLRIYTKVFLPFSNTKTMTACPMKIMRYPAFDDFLYLYNENRYAKIIGEKIQELNRCTTHCCWQQQWAKYGKQTTSAIHTALLYKNQSCFTILFCI